MNILIIANSLEGYGANNSMLDMLMPLMSKGVNVTVLLPGYGPINRELQKRGIYYSVLPYEMSASVGMNKAHKWQKLLENISLLAEATQIVEKRNIEVIHTNASNVDFGALLALKCGLPHVWHVRELLYEHYQMKYFFPRLQEVLFRNANAVITISEYVARKRKFGKHNYTLYNGIDLHKYELNKEICFSREIIRILYCGIISKEKGTMDAIKAIQNLVERGYTNFLLDIVGSESDYSRTLMDYVTEHGLSEYITFYGYQADVLEFRRKADIALMCSRSEALGRVTIESMLGECLVIGAASGATLELIDDGNTGYLYEAGNVHQLAEKILFVYQNKEKARIIVSRAKEYAVDNFDSKRYGEKIYRLYCDVIES